MLKDFFKLNAKLILIILSLILVFVTLSCSDDSSEMEESDNNLLEKLINYGGSYYGRVDSKTFISVSFEKENKLKLIISTYKEDSDKSDKVSQYDIVYKILDNTPIQETKYYRIKSELLSYKVVALNDDEVIRYNYHEFYSHKDWQKAIPKDITTELIGTTSVINFFTFLASEDKNSITWTYISENNIQKPVLTYNQ